ncbi:MAG: class I SAM-dependent methyltransferase [Candidatus Omnitrophota bacterium]
MAHYFRKMLKPLLPTGKGIKILDFGCGTGLAMQALKDMGYSSVLGVDQSRELSTIAQGKNLTVEVVPDAVAFLKTHESSFDVILLLDVLEHIPKEDQMPLLTAIKHALTPEGQLICKVPNANNAFAMRRMYNDYTHEMIFTEYSLNFLVKNSGFNKIFIQDSDYIFKPSMAETISLLTLRWILLLLCRFSRRIEALAECGYKDGVRMPLSESIILIAKAG